MDWIGMPVREKGFEKIIREEVPFLRLSLYSIRFSYCSVEAKLCTTMPANKEEEISEDKESAHEQSQTDVYILSSHDRKGTWIL